MLLHAPAGANRIDTSWDVLGKQTALLVVGLIQRSLAVYDLSLHEDRMELAGSVACMPVGSQVW